jgi:phosphoglycolate phosphatase-like HAD superfamily hydrolase
MAFDPSRVRGLCFDLDGTLSDTDDMFVHRLVHWLNPFRFLFPGKHPQPFARKVVMATETPGNFLFGLADRLGVDRGISDIGDIIYRMGLGRSADPFELIQGVQEMLEKLQAHYQLSIVSARGQRNAYRFLEQFGLTSFFVCVATAHTCKHTKPYPDPVVWAARQMGLSPDVCVMIGDTVVDIKAGKAAGAQTVGVLCGFGHENELRLAGANLILTETPSLSDVLLKSS